MRSKAPLWDNDEVGRRILYHCDDLIVFNKPYDWPTSGHDLYDEDCVQFHLIRYLRENRIINPTPKHPSGMVWAIHQLDADTSGALLFSANKKSVHHYHQLLTATTTEKKYLAIVAGTPDWDSVTETTALGRHPDGSRGALAEADGGKYAHTEFTVLERYENYSVLRVRLITGRTHQIRIHLSLLGHPLLGEEWYAPQPCERHFRQALHAYSLSIPNLPQAPIPEDFSPFLGSRSTLLNEG